MKLLASAAIATLVAGILAGCGGLSDEERAQAFAAKACRVQTDADENVLRDSNGKPIQTPKASPSTQQLPSRDVTRELWPWEDGYPGEITETRPATEIKDWSPYARQLNEIAKNATAAAQLNPSWQAMARDASTIRDTLAKLVSYQGTGAQLSRDEIKRGSAAEDELDAQCEALLEYL